MGVQQGRADEGDRVIGAPSAGGGSYGGKRLDAPDLPEPVYRTDSVSYLLRDPAGQVDGLKAVSEFEAEPNGIGFIDEDLTIETGVQLRKETVFRSWALNSDECSQ